MTRPRLDLVAAPVGAGDLVVLAHGGQEHSLEEPHDWRHPLLRMWPFAAAARTAAPRARIGLLRYRYRGWNGAEAHPVADLRAVLAGLGDEVERVALVGHSMGGRAVLSAADPRVVGVLAMAPWVPEGEPVADLGGRTVVLAHGNRDRTTDPRLTAEFAARVRQSGVPVALFDATGEEHALLARHGDWEDLVRRFVRTAFGLDRDPTVDAALSIDPGHGADSLPAWSRRRGALGAVATITATRLRHRVL
ncbi:MAG: alpha/beta hydrolase [Actinomycetota bacterium]|nr:alpha/beta hydrolase [Actinomycetota bacterium]